MNRSNKIGIIQIISETLTLNKLENMLTENGDQYILSIAQTDIPKDGIHHEHLRRIVNTSTFRSMKIGQFNVIFIFDISEDKAIVPDNR